MTKVRMICGSRLMFGPGSTEYAMPMSGSSAAAGSPVRSATHRTSTTTATAARTKIKIVSTLTGSILQTAACSAHSLDADIDADGIRVPHPRATITGAPHFIPLVGDALSEGHATQVRDHYRGLTIRQPTAVDAAVPSRTSSAKWQATVRGRGSSRERRAGV
jgi:hypothetical protein